MTRERNRFEDLHGRISDAAAAMQPLHLSAGEVVLLDKIAAAALSDAEAKEQDRLDLFEEADRAQARREPDGR